MRDCHVIVLQQMVVEWSHADLDEPRLRQSTDDRGQASAFWYQSSDGTGRLVDGLPFRLGFRIAQHRHEPPVFPEGQKSATIVGSLPDLGGDGLAAVGEYPESSSSAAHVEDVDLVRGVVEGNSLLKSKCEVQLGAAVDVVEKRRSIVARGFDRSLPTSDLRRKLASKIRLRLGDSGPGLR